MGKLANGLNKGTETLHRYEHTESDNSCIEISIIEALAEFSGVDPTDVCLSLDEYIIPGSLDSAYFSDNMAPRWSLSFEYGDYVITVLKSGLIQINLDTDVHDVEEAELPRCT